MTIAKKKKSVARQTVGAAGPETIIKIDFFDNQKLNENKKKLTRIV